MLKRMGAFAIVLLSAAVSAQQAILDPLLPENAVKQVSPHVHVIMGFPNIGFVVGERAVLVVDTGLGDRNGALVAREAAKLSHKGQKLYLTTTHFHPEHAGGQGGFPAGTTVIRSRVQQAELEADGPRMIAFFSGRSEQMRQLLAGGQTVKADVLFDREHDLDLGGVHARIFAFGAAHTKGDEIIYVPEDSLILPEMWLRIEFRPTSSAPSAAPGSWIAVLDKIAPLKPKLVVPDHGDLGDDSLIAEERAFLADLQSRSLALKAEGRPAEEAGRIVAAEFAAKYAGWTGLGNIPQSVARAYADPVK